MISNLELKQFRGLEHVRFENLGRANLIIGGNNTGKTSILEALVLLLGDTEQVKRLPITFRIQPQNSPGVGFWPYIIKGSGVDKFLLTTSDTAVDIIPGRDGTLFARIQNNSHEPTNLFSLGSKGRDPSFYPFSSTDVLTILTTKQGDPSEISDLYSQIAPLNPENELKIEELLRKAIDPRLRRLRYAKPPGEETHLVYVDFGDGPMLPMTQLGQAFIRTLQIYCEIFANRPKIILIDEIENGLYHEGMEDFWKGLMVVLEDQDVQLFATTHSRECMEAAQKAASGMGGDPLRFMRLDRMVDDPSKIVGTTFGKREMETAIEFKTEMR